MESGNTTWLQRVKELARYISQIICRDCKEEWEGGRGCIIITDYRRQFNFQFSDSHPQRADEGKGQGRRGEVNSIGITLRIANPNLCPAITGHWTAGGWSVGVGDDCTNWASVGFSCESFSLLLLLLSLAKRNMSRGLALGFAFAFWLCVLALSVSLLPK